MTKIYVLYDPKCELCCRLKNWILVQRSWMGIAVIEQGSEKAKRMFPELDRIATKEDLAVISDEGAVYLNDHAWIMVLYAMVEYRDWAARLTHPLLMPLARQAFAALSKNRHFISSMLNPENTEALATELRKEDTGACALPASAPVRDGHWADGGRWVPSTAEAEPSPKLHPENKSVVRDYLQ